MPFVILPTNSASGGYDITNSARFNSGSSDYLNRTFGSPTNNKIFTFSFWIKRGDLAREQFFFNGAAASQFYINSEDKLYYYDQTAGGTYKTTQVFRDVSAWYHIVVAEDTTQATAGDRVKIYVNGTQVTAFDIQTNPTQNNSSAWNANATAYYIGRYNPSPSGYYWNGYFSETYFIDGQQLTPSSFGETDFDTGIWKPKAYTGTYGTNGFYLQFKNSASLGTDSSGNGNTFTVNNLTSVDQSTDTPTNNFCTLNPLYYGVNRTITEGNLKVVGTTTAWSNGGQGTIGVTAGKWYFEGKVGGADGDTGYGFGWSDQAVTYTSGINSASKKAYNRQHRAFYNNNSGTDPYFNTVSTGDILMCAFDADNGKIWFGVNGTWQNSNGTATNTTYNSTTLNSSYPDATGITVDTTGAGVWTPSSAVYNDGQVEWNFGNPPYTGGSYTDGAGFGNFSYAVPSGYYALCTKNLATYG